MGCPQCGHDAIGKRSGLAIIVASWFRRDARAVCPEDEDSVESGMGLPGPCGCKHPFHA